MKKAIVVYVARTAGFCFGVKRAIRMAHELAQSGGATPARAGRVYMLGDLVHNQDVIARLEKAGIKKITRLGNGRDKTLLIRAHGAGKYLMAQARKRGYRIVDATCPMVRAIHTIVKKMDGKGYRIIVLGDRHHEEVQGIVGQIEKKTLVIDPSSPRCAARSGLRRVPPRLRRRLRRGEQRLDLRKQGYYGRTSGRSVLHRMENIPWPQINKIRKAAIVVQSTQNMDHILPIVAALRGKIKEVKFFNTICRPTRMKQAEMKTMPLNHDVIIVIGSRTSANTRRLYEISSKINPRSYRIESAAEIMPDWFKKAKKIGITAGASTPQSATRAVIERIRKMK